MPGHHGPLHGGTRCPHHCPAQSRSLRISIGFLADLLADELPVGREGVEGISRQQQGVLAKIRCLCTAWGWRAIDGTTRRSRCRRPIPSNPTQTPASGRCLRSSRCSTDAAHTRRLRPLLLLHFHVYREPSPLARAAVRHRNRSINEMYDRIYVVSLGAPKRNLTSFVSPPGEERRRTARLCSGLLGGGADMSATIRRDNIVDRVVGNRRPFTVHLDLVMVANHAALRRATVHEVTAGASAVVSVQL